MLSKRFFNVWRAVLGSSLTHLEVENAESMLELEREDLRQRVAKFNLGLAGYAALSERLKADLKRLGAERNQLEPKLRARIVAGDRVSAGRHALRIEAIDAQVSQQQEQLAQTEDT
jgi:phage shock protein A